RRRTRVEAALDALENVLPLSREVNKENIVDDCEDYIKSLQLRLRELSQNRLRCEPTSNHLQYLEGYGHYNVHENTATGPLDDILGKLLKENPTEATKLLESKGQQFELEGDENENVPLYYYITDNIKVQFEREEFRLVTGLRFRVENLADYNDGELHIPFRRRVFPSSLDGEHIAGNMRGNKTKNNVKKSNLSPLNLGNALDDDNEGGDDVMFFGAQFTGNYLVYENVDVSKHMNSWMELLIRNRPKNASWTVAYTNTISVHMENQRFLIETDQHAIGTLDGSTRPYPAWNNVNWVFMPIQVGRNHWVTGVIDLPNSHVDVFDSLPNEGRKNLLWNLIQRWTPVVNNILQGRGYFNENRKNIVTGDSQEFWETI
nr:transcription factor bHLH69-like [Tanacetum cinerariifolium]